MNPSINTPLHEHPLEQVNPMIVYQNYQGHWRCDNCHKENSAHSFPYHCRTCSFDLCPTCVQGNISLAHRHDHPMFYLDSSRICYQDQNGTWKCAVCKNTNNALRETFSYHCPICRLDICQNCFQPQQHPIHIHELKVVDTSLIYAQTAGNWFCDVCSRPSRASEKFSHHCAECEFDVCRDCFEPHTTPLHEHPLVKADSHNIYARFNGGWRCDHCDSVHNSPTDNNPWHCVTCDYDLCDNCMGSQIEAPDVHGPSAGHVGRNRGFDLSGTLSVSSNRQPSENPWLLRRHLSPPSSPPDAGPVALPGPSFTTERGNAVTSPEEVALYTDDSSKCIICMEQPKNATLIHGDTGHCATCWLCAQVLKQRGDPCPICRAPIEKVIRQFNA